jgi:type IV pilus assembly protein PilW
LVLSAQKNRLGCSGFTLLELLIAMVVGLIAMGVVYSVIVVQQRSYYQQRSLLGAHQNLRGAMVVLEQQIRLAGFDPEGSGHFGITDVRRYDTVGTKPKEDGQPALFYTVDRDENGAVDDRNHNRNGEHPNFRIRDDLNTGRIYLAFDLGGGRQPLAENIQAIGLAYAVDTDRDGRPDTWDDEGHLIWAVDSDNDNRLDTHIDTNNDGVIDERDDSDGDFQITAADGGVLKPPVAMDRICAVRVWLLAAALLPVKRSAGRRPYVVGDRLITKTHGQESYQLLETVVQCRNL